MEEVKGYLVVNPQVQGVTALVHAPSTEKARTVFLDWLERNKGVSRSLRGQLRATTITKKVNDGEGVDYTIELDYGYEHPSRSEVSLPPMGDFDVQVREQVLPTEVPTLEAFEATPVERVPAPEPEPASRNPITNSPIAQTALGDPIARLGRGLGV